MAYKPLPLGATLDDIILGLQRLAEATRENAAVRKTRVIVKMAKNVEHGDLIEFPGYGTYPVTGWSQTADTVILSCQTGYFVSLRPTEKVRLIREVEGA